MKKQYYRQAGKTVFLILHRRSRKKHLFGRKLRLIRFSGKKGEIFVSTIGDKINKNCSMADTVRIVRGIQSSALNSQRRFVESLSFTVGDCTPTVNERIEPRAF